MFTGIIKEVGRIKNIKDIRDGKEIEISCSNILKDIKNGDSICVSGCCLTVKAFTGSSFLSDISFSTLESTGFKKLQTGDPVNLEDSLKPDDRLGGHFVTGHVDSPTSILKIEISGDFYRFAFKSPRSLLKYIVTKGSVSIEGISLTVEKAESDSFSVVIIPHTLKNTNLKSKRPGDAVNLEIDIIARYIARIINQDNSVNSENKDRKNDELLKEKLIKYGFYK